MERSPKILIVDDDPKMTDSVRAILSGRGYQIETTNNSRTALEHLDRFAFDLAILDIMMPEMSGFQIMDSLDRVNLDTLFIIMTGDASIESAIEAVRKGANDYIRKPFEPDELVVRVENLLRQKRMNDERKRVQIEKKNLENQLRQSHKMEAIGTLAGGIAHDFNNMLGIIIGNAELALEAVPEGDHARQYLLKILTASTRAEEMINRLLSFSRMTDAERRPVKLNEVLGETLKLLRSSLPANIEIRERIPPTSFTVHSDPTQINQIMLNLCTNAAHAMRQSGGILEVRVGEEILDEGSIAEYSDLIPGHYCKLIVSDTGDGIERDIIPRIFEPYFTTKEPGKGTGMGLAVVHGIVKNHKGDIKVFSEPGRGTEFHIRLPLADVPARDRVIGFPATLKRGEEHILLVDDEDMIVDIMKEMLEQLGYHVTPFNRSMNALEGFRLEPEKYDLVITDMTMPNMTGDRLAKEMKKIKPDIPIVLCSGFNEAINKAKCEMEGIQDYLMKPVNMNRLSTTIRKVLDTDFIDRRKHKRYATMRNSFVILDSDFTKRYHIVDVSEGGLSFKYPMKNDPVKGFHNISIVTPDGSLIMDKITYKPIWDMEIQESSATHEGPIRRCGIQFDALTAYQMERLDYFIKNYTRGLMDQEGSRSIQ